MKTKGGKRAPRPGKNGVSRKPADEDLKKFGQPLDYTYLMGTYMAVNAVAGTVILIDGPDCAMGKVEHIFGKHDLGSTLLECRGLNRVECSFTDARNTVLSREVAVEKNMLALARREDVGAILLSSLPMTFVTGTDYNLILRKIEKKTEKPLHYILPRSLNGGHLEGYAETLRVFAEDIPLAAGKARPGTIAVIGYFMDRAEEDHAANLAELRRMLSALGLETVSIWFDGSSYGNLSRVQEAETLLCLPYGRKAAAAVSKRTGARVLDAGLPIGLEGTRAWLGEIARELGREDRARLFMEEELRRAVPRMEWVVPHYFLNKRFWVSADAYQIGPLAAFFQEFGGIFSGGATVGEAIDVRAGRASGNKKSGTVLPGNVPGALVRPTSGLLEEELKRAISGGADLILGNSDVLQLVPKGFPTIEFGYPSYFTHAVAPSPFLGFAGALSLMDRVVNVLGAHAAPRASLSEYETGKTIRSG